MENREPRPLRLIDGGLIEAEVSMIEEGLKIAVEKERMTHDEAQICLEAFKKFRLQKRENPTI